MKKFDIILVIFVLLAAGSFIGINQYREKNITEKSHQLRAEISVKGQIYKDIPLSQLEQQFVIETDLGRNVIKIHDYGIEVVDADCPDQICVKTGIINKPGEIIACLPHKVAIEIKGDAEAEIDGLSN